MTRTEFDTFVRALSRKMYGFAFRILRKQEDAEDAVQEVFIRLWKMGDALDEYLSVEALATTMVKNYCIDQIRKRKRSKEDKLFEGQDFINASAPSPLDQLENSESETIIQDIIENLPDRTAYIVKLREIDGLSYEEIAGKTGQNVNALRVAVSRARTSIRDEYNKYHYERKEIETPSRKVL